MNESVFREILGESLRREFAEFDNAPEHRFSLRHRLAMRRVFAKYERNTRGFYRIEYSEAMPHYGLKQRIIIMLVIIILMTLLTGWFFPIRGVTEAQIDLLRSRYDFSDMKIHTGEMLPSGNDSTNAAIEIYRVNDEYLNFLADLEDLEIYTSEEMKMLKSKAEPIDTRPNSFANEFLVTEMAIDRGNDTPLDSTRRFVSRLEDRMTYYIERSKDPNRAVSGDAEFAELIRKKYWILQNDFLELLEKLFADESDDDSESGKSCLSHFDKDDKRYLWKINKL